MGFMVATLTVVRIKKNQLNCDEALWPVLHGRFVAYNQFKYPRDVTIYIIDVNISLYNVCIIVYPIPIIIQFVERDPSYG